MSDEAAVVVPDELVRAKRAPDIVDVAARTVLSLQGEGDPNGPGFEAAIGALYGIAYTLRFSRKDAGRAVFKPGPLMGEWRAEGTGADERPPSPEQWRWTIQIDVPADMTEAELGGAVEKATTKRGGKLEGSEEAKRVALLRTEPTRYARILHVGPYAEEPATMEKLDAHVTAEGLSREPWHVEVYLSDPSRTAPEKLKTVLLAVVR